MKIKRYHTSIAAAREYIASMPRHLNLRVWPIKTVDQKTHGKRIVRVWIGSYLEWLNRY